MTPETEPPRILRVTRATLATVLLAALPAWPATFTVVSTENDDDANPGDGICDDGEHGCTLNAAIEEANALAGADVIEFNLSGGAPYTSTAIMGTSDFIINEAVTIDGTTQPEYAGSPVIVIDASLADDGGFDVQAGPTMIRGFAIHDGPSGIKIQADNTTIEGCYIGFDESGISGAGNANYGIYIEDASNNTIGGTTAAQRNVIGNNNTGIYVEGSSSTGNVIQGNYIGVDATGLGTAGNGSYGIYLNEAGANTIGGTTDAERNVISANDFTGIYIVGSSAAANVVQGNYIGVDASCDASFGTGNGVFGLLIQDAALTQIGGTATGAGNVIAGNGATGIRALSADGTVIEGNAIGTDPTGAAPLANGADGIGLYNSQDVTIGGTDAGAGNIIAFNGANGVLASGQDLRTTIQGNSIHSNIGIGIDLWDEDLNQDSGVTENDAGDTDGYQNFPDITDAVLGSTQITGTLNSTANTDFHLEFFASPNCAAAGNGEGHTFLGSHEVTFDGGGDAAFVATLSPTATAGYHVTATATDEDGNTSEFSDCFQLPGSPVDDDDPKLYSLTKDDDQLRQLDPATGATLSSTTVTLSGQTVTGGTGLAYDPTDGTTLFGLLKVSGQESRQLVTIDPATGVASLVGDTDGRFAGLAIATDGTLYGVTGESGEGGGEGEGEEFITDQETIFTFDGTDGSATSLVARGDGGDGEAIGFSPEDERIYHGSGDASEGSQIFESLDPAGLATGSIDNGDPILDVALSLTFWEDQGLFLVSDRDENLYSITTDSVAHLITDNMPNSMKGSGLR